MKNEDTPAMPSEVTYKKHLIVKNERTGYTQDHGIQEVTKPFSGLTKREHFAGLAMQGLCFDPTMNVVSTVNLAVVLADALLEELEK